MAALLEVSEVAVHLPQSTTLDATTNRLMAVCPGLPG